jgi:hypothetical protein
VGKIGDGYGSEWHLLRFLGRHREELNRRVIESVGCDRIEWLDFGFDARGNEGDSELRGIDFLNPGLALQRAWSDFWPQSGNVHNWDAIAKITCSGSDEWLLVEAKAHTGEVTSSCGATSESSITQIKRAFSETKRALAIPDRFDWLHPYYQLCNRVAVLHFLRTQGIPARLLFIYFLGDTNPSREAECPKAPVQWQTVIDRELQHVGLNRPRPFSDRIHHIFLDVAGRST